MPRRLAIDEPTASAAIKRVALRERTPAELNTRLSASDLRFCRGCSTPHPTTDFFNASRELKSCRLCRVAIFLFVRCLSTANIYKKECARCTRLLQQPVEQQSAEPRLTGQIKQPVVPTTHRQKRPAAY